MLSRDRSGSYKSGMTQGAPDATQVADRFHLLQNVTQVLGQVLEAQGKVLKLAQPPECCNSAINPKAVKVVPATQSPECCNPAINPKAVKVVPALSHPSPKNQQKTQQRRTQRLETYQTICQLHEQGWSTAKIAQQVSVSCANCTALSASLQLSRMASTERPR